MLNQRIFISIRRHLPIGRRSPYNVHLVFFSITGIAFLLVMAPLFFMVGLSLLGKSAATLALAIVLNLGLLRMGMPGFWAQTIFQSLMIGTLLFCAWNTGGVSSPVLVFMSIVPLLPAYTTRNRNWVLFWLIMAFASVAGLLALQLAGIAPTAPDKKPVDLMLSAAMYCILCITQWSFISSMDQANQTTVRKIKGSNLRLQRLSDDLKIANTHKDRFLATVSHEMRTPLNAVIGYLNLAGSGQALNEEMGQFISNAQNSASHLVTVINDLLDYSQIQNGTIVLNPQAFCLHTMLRDTHAMLHQRAAEQGLVYLLQVSPDVPQWVRADQHRLRQILINLLANALKFTLQGSVTTRVDFKRHVGQAQRGSLHVEVQDTGPGIAPEAQARIFEPFVQLNREQYGSTRNDALRGNGLGLSISQSLAKSHGGHLALRSVPGQGATFTLSVPMSVMSAPEISAAAPEQTETRSFHVLIVDDHEVNRLVAAATLRRSIPNVHIDHAENGLQGLDCIAKTGYDLVLLDLVMPDMDGIEMTRRVRQTLPAPACNVPVLALTANVAQEALKACAAVGINEVMAKPFDRHTLINRVLFYCAQERR
jgi:signal transduction histidine kinase/CheY-like chemotaxis protein